MAVLVEKALAGGCIFAHHITGAPGRGYGVLGMAQGYLVLATAWSWLAALARVCRRFLLLRQWNTPAEDVVASAGKVGL